MRVYHFGNFYLSSIQQGIQSAHAQMELFNKYREIDLTDQAKSLFDWSRNHKTMICLNGGTLIDLLEIETLFKVNETTGNNYPWASFREDAGLGNMLTNVCIVIPDIIYESAEKIRSKKATMQNNVLYEISVDYQNKYKIIDFSDFDVSLINLLNSCSLAK